VLLYSAADYNNDGSVNDIDFTAFGSRNASLLDTVYIMLKLSNKDKDALSLNSTVPAPDGTPLNFNHIINLKTYITAHSEYGFDKYFKGNFAASPNDQGSYAAPGTSSVSSLQLYKALLITLGYKENVDFNDSTILTKCTAVGFKNVRNLSSINYMILSDIVYESLFLNKKDGEVLSLFMSRNNSYFNNSAIKMGLVSFFPGHLPAFEGGSLVVDSYKTQTLASPAGSGQYTEWEARYTNVKLADADAYKNLMTSTGWKTDAVYTKTTGTGTAATTDRYYVYSRTVEGISYFSIFTLNEASGNAHLWLAA
jgi:hypothetical protein